MESPILRSGSFLRSLASSSFSWSDSGWHVSQPYDSGRSTLKILILRRFLVITWLKKKACKQETKYEKGVVGLLVKKKKKKKKNLASYTAHSITLSIWLAWNCLHRSPALLPWRALCIDYLQSSVDSHYRVASTAFHTARCIIIILYQGRVIPRT